MDIVITDWALQSYLDLNHTFTKKEYFEKIRPNAELLKNFSNHPAFSEAKFWGPCKDKSGRIIHQGYKMKWHNIGSGRIQLRLLIVFAHNKAHLCNAYIKDNETTDFREMAKLKIKIHLINENKFVYRGRLM